MKFKKCKTCDSKIEKINKTYDLVKCENCFLVFSENIYKHQDFVAVYDELYNKIVTFLKLLLITSSSLLILLY